MTQEQAALIRAMIRADLVHRTDPTQPAGVLLNKAISGFSLRTAQSIVSFGIGRIVNTGKTGNFAYLHNPEDAA